MFPHETHSGTLAAESHSQPKRPWYAIHVQSKFEKTAASIVRGKGYEEFLPLCRTRRRWSDRVKQLELPLFPGYFFCRMNVTDGFLPILTTPGVVRIVSAGKYPVAVADSEIDAIQTVLRSGLPTTPWPSLSVGSRVIVEHGPLAGVEGTVLDLDKKFRLVLSVALLQRAVAVEIEREWVRPLSSNGRASGSVPLVYSLRGSAGIM